MNCLPNEILTRILEFCDRRKDYDLYRETLRNVRLVSRCVTNSASRLLFAEVCVVLHPDSLNKLRNISHSGTFNHYVRKLRLSPWIIDPGFDEIAKAIAGPPCRWKSSTFQSMARLQHQFIAADPDLYAISMCIGCFPNLERAVVARNHDRTSSLTKSFRGIPPIFRQFVKDLEINVLLTSEMFHNDMDTNPICLRALQCMIYTFGKGDRRIRELQCQIPHSFWEAYDTPGNLGLAQCSANILGSLTRLNIQFRVAPGRIIQSSITSFLYSATQLTDLTIEFKSSDRPSRISIQHGVGNPARCESEVSEIFAQLSLPKLQRVEVYYGNIDRSTFVSFMMRHSSTLQSLRMFSVYMTDSCKGDTYEACLSHPLAYAAYADVQVDPLSPELPSSAWATAIRQIAPRMNLKDVKLWYLVDSSVFLKMFKPYRELRNQGLRSLLLFMTRLEGFLMHKGLGKALPIFGEEVAREVVLAEAIETLVDGLQHYDQYGSLP